MMAVEGRGSACGAYEAVSMLTAVLSVTKSMNVKNEALVRTDVSVERSAFFIRAGRINELGTTLAITDN
jgi:hypothetical protein